MPDIAIMALAAAVTLVVAWAARLKMEAEGQDDSKGQDESLRDLAKISAFLAFIAVSVFFFYITQIQVLGHNLQGAVFAILGGIVFGVLIFLWWPLHQKAAADDFDRLRYRTLSIMIGVVVFLSLAWNDLSAALTRLVRGAHEVSVAGVVTIRGMPDRAEGAGTFVPLAGAPARGSTTTTRERSLVTASAKRLGELVGMGVAWPTGFVPTQDDRRSSCLRTDFFKENSPESKALLNAVLGESSRERGQDIDRTFPLAAHWLYISFLHHGYFLYPSEAHRDNITNALQFFTYLREIEKLKQFPLSEIIDTFLPAFCILLDLRPIFVCLIKYTEVVPDPRLLLLDIHELLRALESFSLAVSQGRSGAEGASSPASKLEQAIKKLADDAKKILSNVRHTPIKPEQNTDWKKQFEEACEIAYQMHYSFEHFFKKIQKDRQYLDQKDMIVQRAYAQEKLKETIFLDLIRANLFALVGSTESSLKIIQDHLKNNPTRECNFSLSGSSSAQLVLRCWQHVLLVIEFCIALETVTGSHMQSGQFARWMLEQLAFLDRALDLHAGASPCSSIYERRSGGGSADFRDVLYRRITFIKKAADLRALTDLFEGEPGDGGFGFADLEKLRKIHEAFHQDQCFRHVPAFEQARREWQATAAVNLAFAEARLCARGRSIPLACPSTDSRELRKRWHKMANEGLRQLSEARRAESRDDVTRFVVVDPWSEPANRARRLIAAIEAGDL